MSFRGVCIFRLVFPGLAGLNYDIYTDRDKRWADVEAAVHGQPSVQAAVVTRLVRTEACARLLAGAGVTAEEAEAALLACPEPTKPTAPVNKT